MYDEVRSSYNLGKHFTNVLCQTKDIEDFIGGTLTLYWISPSGELWKPEYIGTHNFEVYEENDPKYDVRLGFMNWQWVSTGKHGKYTPHRITKYVEIYPAPWRGKREDWPRCMIHFKHGKVRDFEHITR